MEGEVVCLDDFEEHARRQLPKFVFDFYSLGALEQETVRENRRAFRRYCTIGLIASFYRE